MDDSRLTYFVYILRCKDRSYYTGLTTNLALRIAQHNQGVDPSAYTYRRRPVELCWSEAFSSHDDAFSAERQIKGWSRKKKEALIQGDYELLHSIVQSETKRKDRQKKTKRYTG